MYMRNTKIYFKKNMKSHRKISAKNKNFTKKQKLGERNVTHNQKHAE